MELRFGSGDDAEWDAFVHAAPGGHHVQTSRWARVKAVQGWQAVRVVARRDGAVVGGAQLLLRRLPVVGALAYAPRAPLAPGDPDGDHAVLDAVDALCRRERVLYLKLQPPEGREDLVRPLTARGYVPSDLEASPTATVRVDVRRSDDELLAAMRTTTRANVRKSLRRGLEVRVGGLADLPRYQTVVDATSARQDFEAYGYDYYRAMWDAFAPGDHAGLILAEHEGTLLSAALLIGYGDTVLYKMGGWNGEGAAMRPNEAMHWAGMQWARDRGYRWYDFEGIPPDIARAVRAGTLSPADTEGTAKFKLGWGGEVAIFPGAQDQAYRHGAGIAARQLAPRLGSLRGVAHKLLGRGR